MVLIGTGTVILYLVSLIFFFLGMIYPNSFQVYMTLCGIFFLVPSVIVGLMFKDRIET